MLWSLMPVWLLDVGGCVIMIVLSSLSLQLAREIVKEHPNHALSTYLLWFCIAIFAFSISRSLGHIVKHILYFSDMQHVWRSIAPFSGSINTITFVIIGSVTLVFNRMEGIIEEMTEDKERIEEMSYKLLNLNREMEKIVSERTMAKMALQVAHEVRNPVLIIGGLIRRLQKEYFAKGQKNDKLESVLEETTKMESMVKHFEELSTIVQDHFSKEDIGRIVEEAIQIVQVDADEKRVLLQLQQVPGDYSIHVDESLLKVAIVHLLRNAIEACEQEERVGVKLEPKGSWIELKIIDIGKGISEPHLAQIFEPFIDGEVKTGLSLPYIKQIIEQHHGKISINSTTGKGTSVSVQLPALFGEFES